MSVKDYFDANAPADVRKRCKNLSQKKAYLTKELGLPLQCEPCRKTCCDVIFHKNLVSIAVWVLLYSLRGLKAFSCGQTQSQGQVNCPRLHSGLHTNFHCSTTTATTFTD